MQYLGNSQTEMKKCISLLRMECLSQNQVQKTTLGQTDNRISRVVKNEKIFIVGGMDYGCSENYISHK